MGEHQHSLQDVLSAADKVVAKICRTCLAVICKDCGYRVFWPDSDDKALFAEEVTGRRLFCRCRPYTKRFANRKPAKRE